MKPERPPGAPRNVHFLRAARAAASPSYPPAGEVPAMNERNLAFLYSPEAEALSYPPDCPFKTQRAGCTRLRLKSLGLLGDEKHFESAPRRATVAELKQFHTRSEERRVGKECAF